MTVPAQDTDFFAAQAPCLAVVVPVFNEGATIASIVKTVLAQSLVQEVIIVDDASSDNTWEALQSVANMDSRVKIFRHPVNQGKGAALRTGFSKVTAPLAIVQDADLEYDPAEYSKLCKPILAGKANVVFGSFRRVRGAQGALLLALHRK